MNASPEYQFVDANILIYAHDKSAGLKNERSLKLIKNLWELGNGCLSIQVLQEFYVSITQKVTIPLDRETAAKVISSLSAWKVHTPAVEDILGAIEIQQQYIISFWDAMIIQSAKQQGCPVLWTEDLNSGQVYAGVKAVNPFLETAHA